MSNRFEPHSSSLVNLVEKYVSQKRDGNLMDRNYFEIELEKLAKSPDQIHDLIVEMDADADIELLAAAGLKRSNRIFSFGLILGILGIVLSIAGAMDVFGRVRLTIIQVVLIAGAFIAVGKSYSEMGMVEKRRKQRALKYQNWG